MNFREKVANKLEEKKAIKSCARCGNGSFAIAEEFSKISLDKNLSNLIIGGPSIPVAIVICNNCGAITAHALAALDLLSDIPQGGKSEW